MEYKNFGECLTQKRLEKQVTLRELAKRLEVSPAFLCDVENDRKLPLDLIKIEAAVRILNLTEPERVELIELAGKRRNSVAPDLPEYIIQNDYVSAALRTAKDLNASEEEWLAFVEDLKKRKQKEGT